jgi:hypothetical protein
MLKEDFVIQSNVKRILVRSNIDCSELLFGSLNRVVYFRGFFRLRAIHIHGEPDLNKYLKTQEFITKTLFTLEKRVKSIPEVRDVAFQLLNWEKGKGRWIRIDEEKGKNKPSGENQPTIQSNIA